eukprot:403368100
MLSARQQSIPQQAKYQLVNQQQHQTIGNLTLRENSIGNNSLANNSQVNNGMSNNYSNNVGLNNINSSGNINLNSHLNNVEEGSLEAKTLQNHKIITVNNQVQRTILNRRINKIVKKDSNPSQQIFGGMTYRQNVDQNSNSNGQYFTQIRAQNLPVDPSLIINPLNNGQISFQTTINSPRVPVHGVNISEQILDKHYNGVISTNHIQNNFQNIQSQPNVTNIHNIKNFNNYHFEIKGGAGNGAINQFLPEDSRSLDRIIVSNSLVNNSIVQQQQQQDQVNQSLNLQQLMITKRPTYNSQNPHGALNSNQTQSNFNTNEVRQQVLKRNNKQSNQSIDMKRNNQINLSNQKKIQESLTKNKFMLTMSRPKNFSNLNDESKRQLYDNSSNSLDPRKKVSPRNNQGSPGISSLAQDAANQSIDEPKKFKIQFPMTPRDALMHLSKYMLEQRKGGPLQPPDGPDNGGFDNDKNEYICDANDHLAFRYEVIKRLGKGSFGQVFKCYDHMKKEFAAVKILRNKKRLFKQGLIEIKLLEQLRDGDPEDKKNIIRIKESFVFRKHLIISFEMLSINLYEFIKMNNFQGVSVGLVRRFAIQLLVALHYMKENNICHCDMKPENILLRKSNKSGIKVIDFGSGTYENEQFYTYIQSRFYRAPEIMMGIKYTPAIDMWSLGCILYELYVGYPIFAGEDEKEQIQCIMEVKGAPPRSMIVMASRRKIFFDDDYSPLVTANSKGKVRKPNSKSLEKLMNCEDPTFVDFLDKTLEWKPEKRLTPEQAFQHPWIKAGIKELKQKIEQQALQTQRSKSC